MKITRKQLRQLINEVRIKPSIPDVPSDDALVKIDDLVRSGAPGADPLADAFGYPEDRSYSDDLKSYDKVTDMRLEEFIKNMATQEIINVYDEDQHSGNLYDYISNVESTMSKAEFEAILKKLSVEALQHVDDLYGSDFENTMTKTQMSKEEKINRIYRLLKYQ